VESETYFNTTSDQREYLDNVLAGVPVDPSTHQYVLSNKNPLYLDPNAINLDGISKPKQ
jgi:hypothetical protein